ncbi:hypothetical protein ACFQ36_15970, partial [Arthrobacter sp. GCM10027362]
MIRGTPIRVRRRGRPAASLVLLLVLSGAACGPAGQPGPTPQRQAPAGTARSPAPGPVSVEISQRRGQETSRRLILEVTNSSGGRLVIEAAALQTGLYDGAAAWVPVRTGGTGLDAGSTVSLPVSLPEPKCGPQAAGGEAAVVLRV